MYILNLPHLLQKHRVLQNLAAPLEEIILIPFFWELGTFHWALQGLAFVVYVKIVSGFITSKVFFELLLCVQLTFWFFVVNLIALVW